VGHLEPQAIAVRANAVFPLISMPGLRRRDALEWSEAVEAAEEQLVRQEAARQEELRVQARRV